MDAPLELVHEATLTPGSLVSKICKTSVLGVNSTHHQGILEPAGPFVATGRSADGIVEVMELREKLLPFFLAVQFHPERLVQKHARYKNIFGKFVEACGKK
jgi:gamma-glutamyl-gamma-aminobutyrate hydrolase PuuD